MTIKLIADNVEIPVKHIRFSDGASSVKLDIPEGFEIKKYVSISVEPTTACDTVIWELISVIGAIVNTFKNIGDPKLILNLPYLPYGRADRIFEKGNDLPLSTFLGVIANWSAGSELHLVDPHSDHYLKFEDKLDFIVKPQYECFIEVVRDIKSGSVLVSPDKGALNKIYKLQKKLDYGMISTTVIEASKTRDPSTGRITGTNLPDGVDLNGKVVYIVDDICDGGGTFLPLAEKLREAGAKEVHLYVTHGIFAKGLKPFKGLIDKLHVYQTVSTFVNSKDILDFNNGLEVK